MRAVILVGGFGTRLRPLTFTIPKQMLPVVELPMIERKIAHLVSHDITDIVLSMGYRPDAFRKAFPDNTCAGARLTYVVESEPLNTAGAIAYAAREAGVDETFLAFNGDTLTDLDLGALVQVHRTNRAEGTIALTPVEDPSRFGVVSTGANGRVEAFIEKPAAGEAPTNLINAGTYVFEPEMLNRVPHGVSISIERDVFPKMVAEGCLYAGSFGRYWIDIGTPVSYLEANQDVLRGPASVLATQAEQIAETAWAQSSASVRGKVGSHVFIGSAARIELGAQVQESVIGAGAVVAAGARIHGSVLLPGAVVHADALVEGSIVGEGASVGEATQLTDLSVIGGGLSVGAGAHLRGARIGPELSIGGSK